MLFRLLFLVLLFGASVAEAAGPCSGVFVGGTGICYANGYIGVQSGAVLYGNGSNALASTSVATNGQILAWVNGIPTPVATTTFGTGLSYSNGQVTSTGESPLTFNYPLSRSVNAISIVATSSLNLTTSSFLSGNISQWTNNSGYLTSAVTSVNGTYPIISSGGNTPTISTGFGTSTTIGVGTNKLLAVDNSGVIYAVGTSTLNASISGNAASLSAVLSNTLGGTGKDSSAFTGLAGINSGSWYAISTSSAVALSITGNAGTVTTNANLSGAVTSSGSNVTSFGSQNAGVLGTPATGNLGMQATSTLYGAVQNGSILAGLNGTLQYVATTTFSSPLTYSAGAVSCATCLTANQSITLSGVVTGSGATAITTAFGTLAQGVLGNPASAATIPTAQATSTLYGNTATFLTTGNVGISSTTPAYKLSVVGTFAVATSTNQGLPNFSIDSVGHLVTSGPKPTLTNCGSLPTVVGNDQAGVITVGNNATDCLMTFANTYTSAPACDISGGPISGRLAFSLMSSTSATTMSFMGVATTTGAAWPVISAYAVSYICLKTQ